MEREKCKRVRPKLVYMQIEERLACVIKHNFGSYIEIGNLSPEDLLFYTQSAQMLGRPHQVDQK